ncbi:MAG TPA: hypothetical protein VFU97_24540 [Xanthobacteraceae bacterium]|nr:hypothetical protein [Xanthobacteraceae bacterium]
MSDRPPPLTPETIRPWLRRIEQLGKPIQEIWIRRSAWPAFKAELETRAKFVATGDGPPFFHGVPIRLVDDCLPRPMMFFPVDFEELPRSK